MQDLTELDDPAFMAEYGRLRAELEHPPDGAADREGLERRYQELTREFDRREWFPR
jgi:hypothetical protein